MEGGEDWSLENGAEVGVGRWEFGVGVGGDEAWGFVGPVECNSYDGLARKGEIDRLAGMPLTADQIVEETAQWPVDDVADLLDRIALAAHGGMSDARMEAWTEVALRRSAELDRGETELIPGDVASARIRKIVGR